jgi:hypothetical protein
MSKTSALADQLRAKYPALGEKVVIDYGRDQEGQWYWRERTRGNHNITHGPFPTKREAEKDSEVVTLGPQCKITETGLDWDPAWDRPQ